MRTGRIYIIKNIENKKVYVGQTTISAKQRFAQHIKDSNIETRTNPLYKEIKNIGKDKFYFEVLEDDVPENELDDREIYYIEKFDAIRNGFNLRAGGKGGKSLNKTQENEATKMFYEGISNKEIAKYFNVNVATIQRFFIGKNMRRRNFDEERMLSLIKMGLNQKQIAEKMNVDIVTIKRHAAKRGIRFNKKPLKDRNINEQELIDDYLSNMKIAEICKKHDISSTSLRRILTKNNVKKRPQIYKHKIVYKD